MEFSCIVAFHDGTRGIGKDNKMVWNVSEDFQFFSTTTRNVVSKNPFSKNAVIMGRSTFESMDCKPLPGRLNIVLSRTTMFENVVTCQSLEEALTYCSNESVIADVFVCGGEQVYAQAIKMPQCTKIYATYIYDDNFNKESFDRFMPEFEECFPFTKPGDIFQSDGDTCYSFDLYSRKKIVNPEPITIPGNVDMEYNALVRRILDQGTFKMDRTKIGTKSIFGEMVRIDLTQGFPLLTSKRTFMKGIIGELLWFIAGKTDSKELSNQGIHIWDGNGEKANLEKLGFTNREEGDLGPGMLIVIGSEIIEILFNSLRISMETFFRKL
jgi:dihydrofolate reductase/thymidylate synthase